ncbi:hypothetical protein [Hyphococcus sp.]|uniref:hypothetical protein n=1 Tax=Hyphococcus sp. TaxID=2038636 RepID=UPI0035C679EC
MPERAGRVERLHKRFQTRLEQLYDNPDLLIHMAALGEALSEGDEDWIPSQFSSLLLSDDDREILKGELADYLEHEPFFERALAFVLDNTHQGAIPRDVRSDSFQNYALRLAALGDRDRPLALMAALYGLALAVYEWRDRARSIPYDPDVHGPIKFSGRED